MKNLLFCWRPHHDRVPERKGPRATMHSLLSGLLTSPRLAGGAQTPHLFPKQLGCEGVL